MDEKGCDEETAQEKKPSDALFQHRQYLTYTCTCTIHTCTDKIMCANVMNVYTYSTCENQQVYMRNQVQIIYD